LKDSLRKNKSTTIFLLIPISFCQTLEAGLCGRSTASLTEALPGHKKSSKFKVQSLKLKLKHFHIVDGI